MADVPFAFIRDMMAAALGVEAHLLRPPYKDAQEFDYRLSRILRADFDYKDIFSASAMHGLEEGTVYYVHNTLELNYVFMPVPGPKPRSVLLFGPFLYEAASGPFFERVLAQNRIGKGDAAALRTFYGTVPEVAEPTMAAHFMPCNRHRNRAPADHAEDADNLQRGSYPNGKENEWSCFAGIEPRSQGYLAEWPQTGTTGLLDRRTADCERIDFPDFRKAVGRPSGIGSF